MPLKWLFPKEGVHSFIDIRGFVDGQKHAAKDLSASDLVAREVVQNSWDAFNFDVPTDVTLPPRLKVSFKFARLSGQEKASFLKAMQWERLCALRATVKSGEPENRAYREILEAESLTLLIASDHGGPGLFDASDNTRGNWASALTKLNGGRGLAGTGGGSYGVGKTAFIRAGRVPLIAAYTCFSSGADAGHTRRGQAFAYWWNFIEEGTPRVGLGRLTEGDEAHVPPLLDEEADAWASKLGLRVRNDTEPADWGLDLVIIEPNFDAHRLVASIETYWWPALVNDDFEVSVEGPDGHFIPIDPQGREDLEPFVETFQVIEGPSSLHPPAVNDHAWKTRSHGGVSAGECMLRPVKEPPPPPGPSEGLPDLSGHRVAMIRSTHMVLWYHKPHGMPAARPAIQGTYVMDGISGSRLLRATEPGFHDYWVTKEKDAEGELLQAVKFAANVVHDVNDHARAVYGLEAGKSDSDSGPSPLARAILKQLLAVGEKVGPPPPPPQGSLAVSISRRPRTILPATSAGSVLTQGEFALRPQDEGAEIEVEIMVSASVVRGRSRTGEKVGVSISPIPVGFAQVAGDSARIRGVLNSPRQISFLTDPYPDEYTLVAECEVMEQ